MHFFYTTSDSLMFNLLPYQPKIFPTESGWNRVSQCGGIWIKAEWVLSMQHTFFHPPKIRFHLSRGGELGENGVSGWDISLALCLNHISSIVYCAPAEKPIFLTKYHISCSETHSFSFIFNLEDLIIRVIWQFFIIESYDALCKQVHPGTRLVGTLRHVKIVGLR